jgi:hypothetical protein
MRKGTDRFHMTRPLKQKKPKVLTPAQQKAREKFMAARPKKGERFGGRQKGTENKFSRDVKEAIITAAELSKRSKGKGLIGYITYLADEQQALYVSLLGRLIPLQAKVTADVNVEHTIKAKDERQMTPQELADYYNSLRLRPATAPPLVIEHDADETMPEAAE